jgi:hypothetical protein
MQLVEMREKMTKGHRVTTISSAPMMCGHRLNQDVAFEHAARGGA